MCDHDQDDEHHLDSERRCRQDGQVVAVHETVERVRGNPVGGALVGGAIGGIGFRGNSTVGAIAGAATGAALSQGSSERRAYQVDVVAPA